jgi:hypothetical protein
MNKMGLPAFRSTTFHAVSMDGPRGNVSPTNTPRAGQVRREP